MPVTALDGIIILVTFLSAVLAMARGLSREVLSLISWGLAAFFAYFCYKPALSFTAKYIHNPKIAFVLTIVILFIAALAALSVISMKFADIVIDSSIGALDRTLGFLFGIVRGVLILAIAILFLNGLVKPDEQPAWIAQAKSKPLFDNIGNAVWRAVPKSLIDKIDEKTSPAVAVSPPAQDNNAIDNNAVPVE